MNTRIATSLPFTELPVAIGNFDETRKPIDRIIIHTMAGTWQGAAARFNNSKEQVSAHYGVKLDGGLIHWLEETFTAYHAGNYAMNQRSIGIEHEDGGKYNDPRPDVLYTASAKLVRDICQFYNIPIDREHILKHSEVKATACPDALDIDRIIREANGISTQPDCDPNWRIERDRNWDFGVFVYDLISIAVDPKNLDGAKKEAEQKIKFYKDSVAQLEVVKTENETFKKELEERQNAINTLNRKIQTLAKAMEQDAINDHEMGVKLLEIEKEAITLRNFMADIGLEFGCDALNQSDSEMYDCIIKKYKERLEPDKQTVKEWEKLIKAFEDSAIYKKVPKKWRNWWERIWYGLR